MPNQGARGAAQAARPRAQATPSYKVRNRAPQSQIDWGRVGILAGGIGVIALLAFGGGYALRHANGGLPVIAAEPGPVRVKPDVAGGAETIGGDSYAASLGDGEGLAPATESPAVDALREKFAPKPAPAPVVSMTPDAQSPAREVASLIARLPPLVSTASAETADAAAPRALPAPGPAAAPAEPAVIAPAHAASASIGASAGGIAVQLAALDSEIAAQAAWGDAQARHGSLLAGRQHSVSTAKVAGRQVWRLRVGGFADVAQAAAFCVQLRAEHGNCTVAAF